MMIDHPSPSPDQHHSHKWRTPSWPQKFVVAARGIKIAIRSESSFIVHLFATIATIFAGWALVISQLEWCLLVLCITIVLSAELMNTAIERLAQAITTEENAHIRDALDIASGAVLTTALAAATLGALILGHHLI